MMTHAGFDDYFKKKFWCEAVSTATKLDNMTCSSGSIQNIENISGFLEKSLWYPIMKENQPELKLRQEEKWECLWDMQMIILVMFTDSSI